MPNSSSYDIINGRKYKKCKANQIRNPLTNRCVNIKTDNKIKKIKSPKIKTCPEGKVLNPKTNRCIKIKANKADNKPAKIKAVSNKDNKIESHKSPKIKDNKKQKDLFKKVFNPFINRVSANIDDRIKYYNLLLKNLDIDEKKIIV